MNSTLFLPKKIKVGYQKRDSTYTGKLAYVIYYDQKGKLKEDKKTELEIEKIAQSLGI